MAVPITLAAVLQQLVNEVRMDLSPGFTVGLTATIGNPREVDTIENRSAHYLNFFFFNLTPFEFAPDGQPTQPLLMRVHCLVTPFALKEGDDASAGYNDLVLLGEAVRVFHETPVRTISAVDYEGVAHDYHIQAVTYDLAPERLNQIWTTLGGELVYHTSVAYEISLVPVLPGRSYVDSPLAGAVGVDVHADMNAKTAPASGVVATPVVTASDIDTNVEGWSPVVCFVHGGACVTSLSFALGSAELAGFARSVWVAGKPGTEVSFRWDVWEDGSGWRSVDPNHRETIADAKIDPERIGTATLVTVDPPRGTVGEDLLARPGQAVLYAVRTYLRGSDQARIEVRSNPLLLSIYDVGSPP